MREPRYERQFHRRCFYGPIHGSHAASYYEPGRFSPSELAAMGNLTNRDGVEVAINRSHNWAKLASLLLALHEMLPLKLY